MSLVRSRLGSSARLLPQRLRLPARSSSIFKNIKDNIQKEIEKNPELKKTLKELREDETLAKVTQAARDASETVTQKVTQAADVASDKAAKAAEQASKVADQAAKAGENIASKGAEAAQVAQQAASEATQSFRGASAADASGKAEAEQQSASGKPSEGADAADASAEPPPPPLYERVLMDISSLFTTVKDTVSKAADSASASAAAASTSTTSKASAGGEEAAPGAGALVIREPTFWERNFNPESPFFERVRGMFGSVGDRVGDGVFGETEQAEAMRELREMVPDFNQESFLNDIGERLGPNVLKAYLSCDVDVLREKCRDQAYATLHASVVDRQTRQLLMDPRILHMSEPELEGIRIIGGLPTPIVAFETHQVYCLRNSLTGSIVEGDEDDIRSFHYLWALQPNEQSDAEEKWQVTELAVRGVMSTY